MILHVETFGLGFLHCDLNLFFLSSLLTGATNTPITHLKKSDGDLNVLWYRPDHHTSVGVFDTGLPTMGLTRRRRQDRGENY